MKKHEEKGVDNAHPLLIRRLSLRFTVYMYKMMGKARKGRKTEERQENLSRSEKGGNRAGSIGGNPSGRVSRFTEHEILPVSSLHRPAPKSGPLSFPARSTHTRTRESACECAPRRARTRPRYRVLLFCPNRSLSAFSGRAGGIRALIRANYTGGSQFNFTYRPSRPHDLATRRIDYRSALARAD